eukprot:g61572.t1
MSTAGLLQSGSDDAEAEILREPQIWTESLFGCLTDLRICNPLSMRILVKVSYAMLCHAMPCHVMLCNSMQLYVMLCYAMLCYVMLCYAMLCYAMLCYAM